MPDSSFPITPGTGASGSVDTRTESTSGNIRQVVVLGDPDVNSNIVNVVTADPGPNSTAPGIVMRLAGSASVQIAGSSGTIGVYLDSSAGTIRTKLDPASVLAGISSSVAVYFSPERPGVVISDTVGNRVAVNNVNGDNLSVSNNSVVTSGLSYVFNGTAFDRVRGGSGVSGAAMRVVHATDVAGSVNIVGIGTANTLGVYLSATAGTLGVKLDTGSVLAGITSSVAVYLLSTAGTIMVADRSEPTVIAAGKQSTTTRPFITNTEGAIKIYDIVQGTITVSGITASINAYIGSTAGTLQVKLDPGSKLAGIDSTIGVYLNATAGTINVQLKPGAVLVNGSETASIFTVSGSTSGGTTSGVTLVAPSASYNYKVFAYSLQTTGLVGSAWRFTNGAGAETELWRPLVTAAQTTSTPLGAVMAVQPPGFLFATGTSTTLALKSDSGSLVHYSVSYIKESA